MTTAVLTYAEAAAGIEAVTAAYTQALDAERPADVVALFTDGGVFEIPGWKRPGGGQGRPPGGVQGIPR
jgi:SnoaL-like domain